MGKLQFYRNEKMMCNGVDEDSEIWHGIILEKNVHIATWYQFMLVI